MEDLEEPYTDQGGGIEKSGPVFSIVITLIITIAICFSPQNLGWYASVNGTWIITPLFDLEILKGYIPFFLALGVFGVAYAVLQRRD